MPATIPKGNMGYDQYTVPDNRSCRTYFCCFPLALENTFPWPFVPILSNFFEEQRTQNHPQCLSGLSRALFPTTFLEIAVWNKKKSAASAGRIMRLSHSLKIVHWICFQFLFRLCSYYTGYTKDAATLAIAKRFFADSNIACLGSCGSPFNF